MCRRSIRRNLLGASERKDLGNMPEVSEIEIIRHFTRLSTWNYAIDLGMYPLGSCTMKYNPRVNEAVARVEGIANGHPYQPEKISQGALHIIKTLSEQSDRDHRHGCDHAATRGGRAWRDDRAADGAGVSPVERKCAQENSDSGFGAWNESGDRRDGRIMRWRI